MSQYGPPSPPPEQPGPAGSYGWSSQQWQPAQYPSYGAPSPYMPTAQPGTLPLRALTLGDYFTAMFATIRNTPGLFFGAALIFGSIAAIISGLGEAFMMQAFGSAALDPYASIEQFVSGSFFAFLATTVLSQMILLLGQTFNWGIYSIMIARGTIGAKTTLSQGFRLLRGQWGKLIGLLALLVVAVIVVYALIALLIFLVFAVTFAGGEPESGGAIAALVLLVFASILVPALLVVFLLIRWYLVIPAMVIEDIGIFAALRRSWGLTRGYFWRTLGIALLFALILGFVAAIITSPLAFISSFIIASAGTEAELFGTMTIITILITVFSTLVTFIVTNMGVLIAIFFYFDYRFRKDGLGLHLQDVANQYAADSATDRFDTSQEHRGALQPTAPDDLIPGRHATSAPPQQPGPYGSSHPGYPGAPGPYPPGPGQ